MSPTQPARVHIQARPVERFDQVVRYMVRHGGQAKFGYSGEIRKLESLQGISRLARRVARNLFNNARRQGFNQ